MSFKISAILKKKKNNITVAEVNGKKAINFKGQIFHFMLLHYQKSLIS